MAKISVPGVRDPLLESEAAGSGAFLDVAVTDGFRIDASRGARSAHDQVEDAEDTDVVELRLEGGIRRWVPVSELAAELGAPLERGAGGEPDTVVVPTSLSTGDATRGVGDWAIQGLRILRAKLFQEGSGDASGMAAERLSRALEGKLVSEPGLYGVRGAELELVEPRFADGDPHLLFIHGTASKTAGAFAGLGAAGGAAWERLHAAYDGRLLACEHHTLTRSPAENALDVVRALPAGARLHVVSHSRGGIVGELLCRGRRVDRRDAFSDEELTLLAEAFEGRDGGAELVDQLRELTALLAEKQPVVERFVPVGSPLRGTTLAGKKLDRWASILLNLLNRLAAVTANPAVTTVTEFTTAFLMGMVKARADWTRLPGLAAQMPDSPLVALLNRPGTRVEGELSAIAGNAEPDGILRRLAVWTTDAFYGEDNDFVVQTSSMLGGAERGEHGRHFPAAGRTIHHCNYFATPASVEALEAALDGRAGEVGFQVTRPAEPELTEADIRARNATEPRPVVFILPGLMGSHLAVGDDRVWLEILDLMFGGLRKLEMGREGVRPVRLVGKAYDDLTRYLQTSHDVHRFPYDWRRSLTEEADRLAEEARATLAATGEPVRFLAHSMGGVLARVMIARHPDVWRDVCARPGGRLVMLGTPNDGSFSIPRVVMAEDATLKKLALLDVRSGAHEVLEVISRFVGVLELMPRPTAEQDLLTMETWSRLLQASDRDWPPPQQEDLVRAAETRALVDRSPVDPAHMCYVAGWAPTTPSALAVEDGKVRFYSTPRGDGQVPWDTGIPDELRETATWYMTVAHGALASDEAGFPAIHDLLVQGRTDRVPRTPPSTRDAEENQLLPPDVVTTFPSEDDLVRTALAMGPARRIQAAAPSIRLSVCHGDVGFARHHVLVGHYADDLIVSAEKALDSWLEGELTKRQAAGLYPGPLETAAVLFTRPGRPLKGGVVVGLGEVGTLSAGGLERTVTSGILQLAANLRDRAREHGEDPPETFGISPVLIGTGEAGISMTAALRAILEGARAANSLLGNGSWDCSMRLSEVEFVELYLDRALESADTLARIGRDEPGAFSLEEEVTARRGGMTRDYASEEADWLWRLQIEGDPRAERPETGEEDEEATLRFTVPTIRASAAASTLAADRRLVDGLLDEAISSVRSDPELSETLFELLIPNAVKDQAPEKRNLLLLVDEGAARYPWELLKDPAVPGDPVAIDAQLIRQLVTDGGRQRITPATGSRMLVIGDPAHTHLSPLEGAEREARDVTGIFAETSYEVREIIRGTHSEIVRALFSSRKGGDVGYRMIHIAAHGEHAAGEGGQSGVVIGDRLYLTPHTFNQLRQVPELVFLNCCHLGRMEERDRPWRPNRIAANLGTQLIRMGVKAVVAAGWAVNDAAARTFSRVFYTRMLDGQTFGEAVLHARKTTRESHPETNTWGAYQCYGDPQFTLPGGRVSSGGWQPSFCHPEMAVTELRNLLARARTARIHTAASLGQDLDRILHAVPDRWRARSEVAEALGVVHGELGRLEEALSYLETAARTDRPRATLASQEKWCNLRARRSARRWLDEDRGTDSASERKARRSERIRELDRAIERLEALVDLFGPSTERLNLLGSAHKRKALVVEVGERAEELREAHERYREARRHSVTMTGSEDYLALVNCLAVHVARRLRGGGTPEDDERFRRDYEAAEGLVAESNAELHPFFGTLAPAELRLIRAVLGGTLDREVDEMARGYENAFRRAGSVGELNSTLDQLSFFHEMLRVDIDEEADVPVRNRELRERVVPALETLRERIAALLGT